MAKKRAKKSSKKVRQRKKVKKPGKALSIIALILNLIILPGLGTLIAGKIKPGVWQVVLALVGGLLSIIFIGIPLIVAAWIWGLVSGVQLIQEAFD